MAGTPGSPLPPPLAALIRQHPLDSAEDTQRVLAGDLDLGARRYARQAADHASSGPWWHIWREIQRVRGVPLESALDALVKEQRQLFAVWAMSQPDVEEGLRAYRRYLDAPQLYGPTTAGTALYLDHLLRLGRYSEVIATVDELTGPEGAGPELEARAVRALLALGDGPSALERLAAVRERHRNEADVWAPTAIVSHQLGDEPAALEALRACARLDKPAPALERQLLDTVGLTPDEWQALRAPFRTSGTLLGEEERASAATDESESPIPAKLLPQVRDLIHELVTGQYAALEADGRAGRVRAADLERVLRDYPAALVDPPPDAYANAVDGVASFTPGEEPYWDIDARLWTREEGRSDLMLRLIARPTAEGWRLEITDLLVP